MKALVSIRTRSRPPICHSRMKLTNYDASFSRNFYHASCYYKLPPFNGKFTWKKVGSIWLWNTIKLLHNYFYWHQWNLLWINYYSPAINEERKTIFLVHNVSKSTAFSNSFYREKKVKEIIRKRQQNELNIYSPSMMNKIASTAIIWNMICDHFNYVVIYRVKVLWRKILE